MPTGFNSMRVVVFADQNIDGLDTLIEQRGGIPLVVSEQDADRASAIRVGLGGSDATTSTSKMSFDRIPIYSCRSAYVTSSKGKTRAFPRTTITSHHALASRGARAATTVR